MLIAISGPTGAGKTTQAKKLQEQLGSSWKFIDQDQYFYDYDDLDKITLSNGEIIGNYESDTAINNDQMMSDIELLLKDHNVIVTGFALKDSIWHTQPLYHIHISIPENLIYTRRAMRGRDIYPCETSTLITDVVIPYYKEVLCETTYNLLIDGTISIDEVSIIIMQSLKKQVRQLLRKSIRIMTISEKYVESLHVCHKVLNNNEYQKSRIIGIYMSTNNEINTQGIIDNILADTNKQCLVPRTNVDSMEFCRITNKITLKKNKWGILEPPKSIKTHIKQLDLLIIPGLGFTQEGNRIGHGKGYYDKYLSKYEELYGKLPYLMGVCFSKQLFDSIPTNKHDYCMDIVITP